MNKTKIAEKIQLLNQKIGLLRSDLIIPISAIDSSSILSIQKCGKTIANHLNLPKLTFIISYAKQKANVGGHIQLDNSNEVFIEIDAAYKYEPEMVLSILAHEICHKFLQKNNIRLFPELENEILTDLTTVYTGLGKLSLNGCEKTTVTKTKIGNQIQTRTQTKKTGYISRDDFAFAFALVSKMRNNQKKEALKDLSPEARSIVASYLDSSELHSENIHLDNLVVRFNKYHDNSLVSTQISLSELDLNLRSLKITLLETIKQKIQSYHKDIAKFNALSLKIEGLKDLKKEGRVVGNYLVSKEFSALKSDLDKQNQEIKDLTKQLAELNESGEKIVQKYAMVNKNAQINVFTCPLCENKMKIAAKKVAKINCSACNYKFIVNTGAEKKKSAHFLDKMKTTFSSFLKSK